ncbi:MAG: aminotransferase class I/II-fold pyridoxal phosphate-dependent enzyme, partial [Pseudomonadota bacterium]
AVIEVPMLAERDFVLDVDALLDACEENTRLVFVCSPNNPTGTPLPRAELVRLLDGRAEQSVIVVDEAYIEFGNEPSVVDVLGRFPNIVVLRTLSKALGFAGARCGAVIGSSEVVRMLNAVQAPYALATPVVECVEDALVDEELRKAENMVADVVRERERVMQRVARYPFIDKVWPSDANFFLARSSRAAAVLSRCAEQKVLLRGFSGDLADCLRITIGSRSDNERLFAALDAFAGEL